METGSSGERILIVDDEAQVCRLMGRILWQDGHACTLANSVSEARELLEAEEFQLAICDINLGSESGLDLATEIHASYPDTAILMASAVIAITGSVSTSSSRLAVISKARLLIADSIRPDEKPSEKISHDGLTLPRSMRPVWRSMKDE